jgi:transcriptional regulator with XRE-family HTH domain
MASFSLDTKALMRAVDAIMRHRNLSYKDVARETGLQASTLTRIGQGRKPDADGLCSLLAWIGYDVSGFAVANRREVDHD